MMGPTDQQFAPRSGGDLDKRPFTSSLKDAPQAAGTRVLIVEDNHDSRVTLEKLLQLHGCEVSTAADGHAGFDAISRMKPDVALVDIGLPDIDGFEVARRVRNELGELPVRLVAVTGYGREDRAAVFKAGFDAHLVKPIDPKELLRTLMKPK
jgi:two-component system, chemotaxis family, CheB/CheR fusion protein